MANSPKDNQERYHRILTAWKTLAPSKTFGGLTLAQFETQCGESDGARDEVSQIEDELKQKQTNRETKDGKTLKDCDGIVKSVVADPEFGDDSALYEAMGYVRKSARKSGLTRKKTEPVK